MKHSYMLMTKISGDIFLKNGGIINGLFIGEIKKFNTNLEDYKVIYPKEHSITSQKMTSRCSGHYFVSKFKRKKNTSLFNFFVFELPTLNFFYFFTNLSLVVLL